MTDFLLIMGIAYPAKALKKDLWNAIKESRRPPEYVIDKMAEEKGDYINKHIHHKLKYLQNVNE